MDNMFDSILDDIQKQPDNAIAMEFTKQIGNILRENGVVIYFTRTEETTENPLFNRYGAKFDRIDFSEHDKGFLEQIKYFEDAVTKFERTVEEQQDEIERIKELNDKCCYENIRLERENKKLHRELQETALIDNLPYEPIAVAEFLINKTGKYERSSFMKAFTGNEQGTYNIYGISELRQIAEHLLVHCNNNKDEG